MYVTKILLFAAEVVKQPQRPAQQVQQQQNVPPMWGNYYPADNPPQSNELTNDKSVFFA